MTPEPFTSSDSRSPEDCGDFSQFRSKPHSHDPHYFDRPGLVWIAICILFATAAARLLPYMAEPVSMHARLVAMGWDSTNLAKRASLPQEVAANRVQSQAPAQEGVTIAVFRQY